jgi:hypothetical protein
MSKADGEEVKHTNGYKHVPGPDPTRLTTEHIDRAISTLKELFDVKVGLFERDIKFEEEARDRVRHELSTEIQHLKESLGKDIIKVVGDLQNHVEVDSAFFTEARETATKLDTLKETVDRATYQDTGQTMAEQQHQSNISARVNNIQVLLFSSSVLIAVISLIIAILHK